MRERPDGESSPRRPRPEQAVYGISVAAELSGHGTHSLRLYEQHGLVTPARSAGGTRRYSDDDLARLARIAALAGDGVNLSAIGRILDLEDDNTALRDTNTELRDTNTALRDTNTALRDSNTELRSANTELTAERDRLRRRPPER